MNQTTYKNSKYVGPRLQGPIRYAMLKVRNVGNVVKDFPRDTDRFIPIINTFPPKFAIVDPEDYEWLTKYRWCLQKGRHTYYARTTINGRTVSMHRLIMKAQPGEQIDHVNGNGLRNVKRNLRFCTATQQRANSKARTPGTGKYSQYKGVTRVKGNPKKWFAQIRKNGKQINIGYFDTELEAARAYDAKAKELFGEFARVNFPERSKNEKSI